MSRLPVDAFVAGADGAAEFRGSVVYHFYPGTSNPSPTAASCSPRATPCCSSFGEDAMRQLLILQKW